VTIFRGTYWVSFCPLEVLAEPAEIISDPLLGQAFESPASHSHLLLLLALVFYSFFYRSLLRYSFIFSSLILVRVELGSFRRLKDPKWVWWSRWPLIVLGFPVVVLASLVPSLFLGLWLIRLISLSWLGVFWNFCLCFLTIPVEMTVLMANRWKKDRTHGRSLEKWPYSWQIQGKILIYFYCLLLYFSFFYSFLLRYSFIFSSLMLLRVQLGGFRRLKDPKWVRWSRWSLIVLGFPVVVLACLVPSLFLGLPLTRLISLSRLGIFWNFPLCFLTITGEMTVLMADRWQNDPTHGRSCT